MTNKPNETVFAQEIDETTQPERTTELIKESMEAIEGALKSSGFKPVRMDDGSLAYTFDENVAQGLEPDAIDDITFDTYVFALSTDIGGMDYSQISHQLVEAQELQGLLNCEIVLQGSRVNQEKHSIRIERSMGTAPFIVPKKYGSFSGLQLADVKSLVFVYPISKTRGFMCAFSDLTIEKHETWCMKNGRAPDEIIYITADHGKPWRLV